MAHSPASVVNVLLMISNFGISSEIEVKLEHASTTGFPFSQRAFKLGKGTRYLTTSFGFNTSLPMRSISSVYSGHAKFAKLEIPKFSSSNTRPPLCRSRANACSKESVGLLMLEGKSSFWENSVKFSSLETRDGLLISVSKASWYLNDQA